MPARTALIPRTTPIARTVVAVGLLLVTSCASGESTGGSATPSTGNGQGTSTSAATADASNPDTDDTDGAGEVEGAEQATAASTLPGPPTSAESTSTTVADPEALAFPATPAEAASALSEAERAVRDTNRTPAERAAWGRRQQQMYRVLASNEGWIDEVVASADPEVRTAVERNWAARVELDALLSQHALSDTLPAWRIDTPLPADELLGYYREAGERHGVPWEVLAAINLIETRMGRINGISTAGAQGPMQFLPTTWAECCEGDPTNDRDAINGAAKYLIDRGGATDLDRAIWGYNNSDHYVAAVTTYAAVLADDPEAYYGYHGWQVYFLSTAGLALLPEGYEQTEPIDAAQWLAENPAQRLSLE